MWLLNLPLVKYCSCNARQMLTPKGWGGGECSGWGRSAHNSQACINTAFPNWNFPFNPVHHALVAALELCVTPAWHIPTQRLNRVPCTSTTDLQRWLSIGGAASWLSVSRLLSGRYHSPIVWYRSSQVCLSLFCHGLESTEPTWMPSLPSAVLEAVSGQFQPHWLDFCSNFRHFTIQLFTGDTAIESGIPSSPHDFPSATVCLALSYSSAMKDSLQNLYYQMFS